MLVVVNMQWREHALGSSAARFLVLLNSSECLYVEMGTSL